MRTRLLVFLTSFLLLAGALAGADFAGTWQFSVDLDDDAGHRNPAFVLKQEGGKLTGTYRHTGTLGGAGKMNGKVRFEPEGENG
jgi:hypothetical protein